MLAIGGAEVAGGVPNERWFEPFEMAEQQTAEFSET
jgi:hypothetical protein